MKVNTQKSSSIEGKTSTKSTKTGSRTNDVRLPRSVRVPPPVIKDANKLSLGMDRSKGQDILAKRRQSTMKALNSASRPYVVSESQRYGDHYTLASNHVKGSYLSESSGVHIGDGGGSIYGGHSSGAGALPMPPYATGQSFSDMDNSFSRSNNGELSNNSISETSSGTSTSTGEAELQNAEKNNKGSWGKAATNLEVPRVSSALMPRTGRDISSSIYASVVRGGASALQQTASLRASSNVFNYALSSGSYQQGMGRSVHSAGGSYMGRGSAAAANAMAHAYLSSGSGMDNMYQRSGYGLYGSYGSYLSGASVAGGSAFGAPSPLHRAEKSKGSFGGIDGSRGFLNTYLSNGSNISTSGSHSRNISGNSTCSPALGTPMVRMRPSIVGSFTTSAGRLAMGSPGSGQSTGGNFSYQAPISGYNLALGGLNHSMIYNSSTKHTQSFLSRLSSGMSRNGAGPSAAAVGGSRGPFQAPPGARGLEHMQTSQSSSGQESGLSLANSVGGMGLGSSCSSGIMGLRDRGKRSVSLGLGRTLSVADQSENEQNSRMLTSGSEKDEAAGLGLGLVISDAEVNSAQGSTNGRRLPPPSPLHSLRDSVDPGQSIGNSNSRSDRVAGKIFSYSLASVSGNSTSSPASASGSLGDSKARMWGNTANLRRNSQLPRQNSNASDVKDILHYRGESQYSAMLSGASVGPNNSSGYSKSKPRSTTSQNSHEVNQKGGTRWRINEVYSTLRDDLNALLTLPDLEQMVRNERATLELIFTYFARRRERQLPARSGIFWSIRDMLSIKSGQRGITPSHPRALEETDQDTPPPVRSRRISRSKLNLINTTIDSALDSIDAVQFGFDTMIEKSNKVKSLHSKKHSDILLTTTIAERIPLIKAEKKSWFPSDVLYDRRILLYSDVKKIMRHFEIVPDIIPLDYLSITFEQLCKKMQLPVVGGHLMKKSRNSNWSLFKQNDGSTVAALEESTHGGASRQAQDPFANFISNGYMDIQFMHFEDFKILLLRIALIAFHHNGPMASPQLSLLLILGAMRKSSGLQMIRKDWSKAKDTYFSVSVGLSENFQ